MGLPYDPNCPMCLCDCENEVLFTEASAQAKGISPAASAPNPITTSLCLVFTHATQLSLRNAAEDATSAWQCQASGGVQ